MNLKDLVKTLKYKLQLFDFVWSLPLAILGFILWGNISVNYFHDPDLSVEWVSMAVESSLILIFFTAICIGGVYFTARGLFKYFYRKDSGIKEEFQKLPSWLKVFSFPLYVFFFLVVLIVIFSIIAVK
jgi:hypothetical protein